MGSFNATNKPPTLSNQTIGTKHCWRRDWGGWCREESFGTEHEHTLPSHCLDVNHVGMTNDY